MSYVLAVDQGTTSSRAVLFDRDGSLVDIGQREFRQIFPAPGWVEHDPEEIWSSQRDVITEVLERARVGPGDIAAIGITNQRETTIVWDRRTGVPVMNAIVWQDRRTADACERLVADGHAPLITERTGLVVDAYFSASKVAWILEHVPGARADAEAGHLAFGTVDTWLAWKLTGGRVHVTEASNASRTMLFDINRGAWDDELLGVFGIPRSMLPGVRGSSEVYAETSAPDLSLAAPIAGIAGDQQAALYGQSCFRPGLAKTTYGTGCFMLLNTGDRPVESESRLLTTVAWKLGDRLEYALEGSVFIGGAVVQWLRDGLGIIGAAEEIEPLARSVDDSGGVVLVPAFAGLGAPHWDPHARGALVGLTRGTTSAHVARAALEGIAHQVADVLAAMQSDAALEIREIRVDGGAAANDLLMQIQADIAGVTIVRPRVTETTALGAARLAARAVGFWPDDDENAPWREVDRRFEPAMDAGAVTRSRSRWSEALDRARRWEQPA
ncbi:MAG: glycerol kinase GlpK [Planctomycetes bacterium]|nr:glycerol kinase GlpK [Planctomycetota bacterium]